MSTAAKAAGALLLFAAVLRLPHASPWVRLLGTLAVLATLALLLARAAHNAYQENPR